MKEGITLKNTYNLRAPFPKEVQYFNIKKKKSKNCLLCEFSVSIDKKEDGFFGFYSQIVEDESIKNDVINTIDSLVKYLKLEDEGHPFKTIKDLKKYVAEHCSGSEFRPLGNDEIICIAVDNEDMNIYIKISLADKQNVTILAYDKTDDIK